MLWAVSPKQDISNGDINKHANSEQGKSQKEFHPKANKNKQLVFAERGRITFSQR